MRNVTEDKKYKKKKKAHQKKEGKDLHKPQNSSQTALTDKMQ